ncbi:MAG: hypothetical protein ABEK42_10860, partial [Thiohalorhabdaceae bacterium]
MEVAEGLVLEGWMRGQATGMDELVLPSGSTLVQAGPLRLGDGLTLAEGAKLTSPLAYTETGRFFPLTV